MLAREAARQLFLFWTHFVEKKAFDNKLIFTLFSCFCHCHLILEARAQ